MSVDLEADEEEALSETFVETPAKSWRVSDERIEELVAEMKRSAEAAASSKAAPQPTRRSTSLRTGGAAILVQLGNLRRSDPIPCVQTGRRHVALPKNDLKITVDVYIAESKDTITLKVDPDILIGPPDVEPAKENCFTKKWGPLASTKGFAQGLQRFDYNKPGGEWSQDRRNQNTTKATGPNRFKAVWGDMAKTGAFDRGPRSFEYNKPGGQWQPLPEDPDHVMRLEEANKIPSVKGMLKDITGIDIPLQRLYYRGIPISMNDKTLRSYAVSHGQTMTMSINRDPEEKRRSQIPFLACYERRKRTVQAPSKAFSLANSEAIKRHRSDGDFWCMPGWKHDELPRHFTDVDARSKPGIDKSGGLRGGGAEEYGSGSISYKDFSQGTYGASCGDRMTMIRQGGKFGR